MVVCGDHDIMIEQVLGSICVLRGGHVGGGRAAHQVGSGVHQVCYCGHAAALRSCIASQQQNGYERRPSQLLW